MKGEAQSVGKASEPVDGGVVPASGDRAETACGLKQVGGLVLEDKVDDGARGCGGKADVLDLTGDHAGGAGGCGEFLDEPGDGAGAPFR